MPTFSPQLLRRIAVVALIVGVLGLGAGASVNQVVSHFLALPEDAEPRTYTDKDAPAPRPATARTVASSGTNAEEDVAPSEKSPAEEEPGALAESEPEEESSRPSRALPADKYAEIIVRRNIFDSSAVYQPAVAAVTGEGECVADDNIRLLATTVADPPIYSSALISEGASRESKARPYAIGETLGSQGKIAYIAQKRVCLEGGSCICMGQAGLAVKERPAGGGEEGGGGSSDGAVSKTGENSYVVDRSFLEEQLGNAEALATQIRPRPHRGTDGEVDGYRLSSIKKGSVFDKLGVKNGDIIHSVNGQPMTSVEGAMSAYSGLSREKAFTFEITRRNQKVTLDYSVR